MQVVWSSPSHTSVCVSKHSGSTCNDMLLSFQWISGHGLIPAGVTTFAMHRRKAGQRRDPQGSLQKPSCQPSATAAPPVGKTPQPATGTPVQLQTLPREQHKWPAGLAAEGWPSSEHLPRRKLRWCQAAAASLIFGVAELQLPAGTLCNC